MSIKTEIKNLLSEAKINDKIKKRKISIAQSTGSYSTSPTAPLNPGTLGTASNPNLTWPTAPINNNTLNYSVPNYTSVSSTTNPSVSAPASTGTLPPPNSATGVHDRTSYFSPAKNNISPPVQPTQNAFPLSRPANNSTVNTHFNSPTNTVSPSSSTSTNIVPTANSGATSTSANNSATSATTVPRATTTTTATNPTTTSGSSASAIGAGIMEGVASTGGALLGGTMGASVGNAISDELGVGETAKTTISTGAGIAGGIAGGAAVAAGTWGSFILFGATVAITPYLYQEYRSYFGDLTPESMNGKDISQVIQKRIYDATYKSCEKNGLWDIDLIDDWYVYNDDGDLGKLDSNLKKQIVNAFTGEFISRIYHSNEKKQNEIQSLANIVFDVVVQNSSLTDQKDKDAFYSNASNNDNFYDVIALIMNDVQPIVSQTTKLLIDANSAQATTGTPQRTSAGPATSNSISSKIAQLRQTLNNMGYQNNQSSPSWDEDLDSAFTKCFISWAQKLFPNAKDLDLAPPISWVLEAPKLGLKPSISGALDFAVAAQKAFSQIQNNPQNAPQNPAQNPSQNPNSPQTLALEGLEAFFNMVNSGLVKIDKKGIDLRNDTKIWKGVIGGLGGSKPAAVHCLKNANFTDDELKTLASIKGASQAQVQGLSQSSAIQKVFTLFLNLYRKSTKAPFRARNPEKIQERVSETNPKEAILKNIELRKDAIRRKFNQ